MIRSILVQSQYFQQFNISFRKEIRDEGEASVRPGPSQADRGKRGQAGWDHHPRHGEGKADGGQGDRRRQRPCGEGRQAHAALGQGRRPRPVRQVRRHRDQDQIGRAHV